MGNENSDGNLSKLVWTRSYFMRRLKKNYMNPLLHIFWDRIMSKETAVTEIKGECFPFSIHLNHYFAKINLFPVN